MKIAICGGGNIAHALVAVLSLTDDVFVMTRRPELWSRTLTYKKGSSDWCQSNELQGISNDPSIIEGTSLIIVAVPRFAICDILEKITPYLHQGQMVFFVPAPSGAEKIAARLKNDCAVEVLGFQRVPYIARITEYGHAVTLSDNRSIHKVVISNPAEALIWDNFISSRFGGKVEHLSSFFAFTFSNANPLLHPARLMVLLNQSYYDRMPLFYEEWTDESSELYVRSDAEMLEVMRKYPEINIAKDYESAFNHYEVRTIHELTRKIKSIPSFRGIEAPYHLDENNHYVPDLSSRYFTEDVSYGTLRILELAGKVDVEVPTINLFVQKIQELF